MPGSFRKSKGGKMSGRKWAAWAVALCAAGTLAIVSGIGAGAARADGDQLPNLADTFWFGSLETAGASVPVELDILSQENRRFMWVVFVGGIETAMGDGTISASGQGSIKGEGMAGNPVGLAEIFAHGMITGSPGSMTADFDFHGRNMDGSMIDGMIMLAERGGDVG
jgi:hypothetical protein